MKFEHFRIFRGVPPTKMWKKKEIVKIRERRCIFYEITEKCGDARGSVRFHDFLHIFVAQTKNPAISWNHQDPRASAHFLWSHRKMRLCSRIWWFNDLLHIFVGGTPREILKFHEIVKRGQDPRASAHFRDQIPSNWRANSNTGTSLQKTRKFYCLISSWKISLRLI